MFPHLRVSTRIPIFLFLLTLVRASSAAPPAAINEPGGKGADDKVIPLELNSVTFSDNHAILNDNVTYASDGTAPVRIPEILKSTGTGQGAAEPTPVEYGLSSPVCYTWGKKISFKANFNIDPVIPADGKGEPAIIKVTGKFSSSTTQASLVNNVYSFDTSHQDVTLSFPNKSVTLKGNSLTNVSFTSTGTLPSRIDNASLSLTWEYSTNSGVKWTSLGSTAIPLMVTAGTPTGSPVTFTRLDGATRACKGLSATGDIAKRLWVGPMQAATFNITADHPPTPLWKLFDNPNIAGQCIDISNLFLLEMKMLGLTGNESSVTFVYPTTGYSIKESTSNLDPFVRLIKSPAGVHLVGHSDADNHSAYKSQEALIYIQGGPESDGRGEPNNYEACMKVSLADGTTMYFAPGTGNKIYNNAQEVMNGVCFATIWTYDFAPTAEDPHPGVGKCGWKLAAGGTDGPGPCPAEWWKDRVAAQ